MDSGRRQLLVRICITVATLGVVLSMAPAWWTLLWPDPAKPRDFFQDYASARNILTGRPVYADQQDTLRDYLGLEPVGRAVNVRFNAHPPTSVLLALPVAHLDYVTAGWIWNVASLVGLLVSLVLLARGVGWRPTVWAIAPTLALLMTWVPLWLHVLQGQLGLFLLLLFTLAWATGRRNAYAWCGVCLGLAATIKLFPVLLLGYLAARGRWGGVVAGIVTMAAVTAGTAAITGVDAYLTYVQVVIPNLNRWRPDWINSSLTGYFAHLFAPDAAIEPLLYSPLLAIALTGVASLGVMGLVVYLCRRPYIDFDGEYGLALTATLLLSALTWSHYFVVLLVPLAIWLRRLWRAGRPAGWGGLFLFVTWVLMAIPQLNVAIALVPNGEAGVASPLVALTVLALNAYGLFGYFGLQAWWLGWSRWTGARRRRMRPALPVGLPTDLTRPIIVSSGRKEH